MVLYPTCSPMLLWFDVPANSGTRLQLKVIRAVGNILKRHPRLRYVTRKQGLFRAKQALVAVRTLYDERSVMNIVVSNFVTQRTVTRQLNQRTKKARREIYKAIPELPDGLDKLIPPSLVCCAVNYSGAQGGESGIGPLSDVEGIPILINVGEPVCGIATITLSMDHRTHDGQDIGLLKAELQKALRESS